MNAKELREELAEYDDDTPVVNRGSTTEKTIRVQQGERAVVIDGTVEREEIVVIA